MIKKLHLIVLIDDDHYANLYNEIILKKMDICEEIKVFQNGKEAIDFLTSETSEKPDMIFLDINMPVMDGWEFLAEYNDYLNQGNDPSFITMLTSSINQHDKERAFKSGIVKEFVSKPLLEKHLRVILNNHFAIA